MPFTVFDVMVLIVATEKSNARKTGPALEAMIRLWLVPTVEHFRAARSTSTFSAAK